MIFAKYPAVKLQTLAEKIANTIYRAAKVCSRAAGYLADIHSLISSFCLSNVWNHLILFLYEIILNKNIRHDIMDIKYIFGNVF